MKVRVWTCWACGEYQDFEGVVAISAVRDLLLEMRESGYLSHQRFDEAAWDRFEVTWA